MSHGRLYASGVFDQSFGLIIMGGVDKGVGEVVGGEDYFQFLSSVERTYDGVSFDQLAEMPQPLALHCAVSMKDGNDIFVTGGTRMVPSDTMEKRAYMYSVSSDSWRGLEDMPTARIGKSLATR